MQVFSAPIDQNPDTLLWEVAALRVRQLDASQPTCPITLDVPGPPARVRSRFQDTGSGLAELLVTKSENADTVVPPFTVGTTDPVVVTATKIDQSKRSRVETRITDLAGNVRFCDPILLLVVRDREPTWPPCPGYVPRAEDKVTITNGTPGLATSRSTSTARSSRPAASRTARRAPWTSRRRWSRATNNTVDFKVTGKPGAFANVMIWDGVGQ